MNNPSTKITGGKSERERQDMLKALSPRERNSMSGHFDLMALQITRQNGPDSIKDLDPQFSRDERCWSRKLMVVNTFDIEAIIHFMWGFAERSDVLTMTEIELKSHGAHGDGCIIENSIDTSQVYYIDFAPIQLDGCIPLDATSEVFTSFTEIAQVLRCIETVGDSEQWEEIAFGRMVEFDSCEGRLPDKTIS